MRQVSIHSDMFNTEPMNEQHALQHALNNTEQYALRKKAAIHQLTTMLGTSNIVLFLGHNHPANHRY